jgi:hypothetical protein
LNGLPEVGFFVLAAACGLLVRLALGWAGQNWAKTYSNTVSYLLLPVIGLVIVQVISNSIALSLGMIGALSIVRFRHPVKSPLELVVYFLLLTVGIAMSTRPNLAVLLTIASVVVILLVKWYQTLRASKGFTAFPLAPGDGDRSYLLEVNSGTPMDTLAQSPDLIFSFEDRTVGTYSYKLAFADRRAMDAVQGTLRQDARVTQLSGTLR